MTAIVLCAACGDPSEQNFSLHRDGFDEGPEVWLCDACGSDELPTCEELWANIKSRLEAGYAMFLNDGTDAVIRI